MYDLKKYIIYLKQVLKTLKGNGKLVQKLQRATNAVKFEHLCCWVREFPIFPHTEQKEVGGGGRGFGILVGLQSSKNYLPQTTGVNTPISEQNGQSLHSLLQTEGQ